MQEENYVVRALVRQILQEAVSLPAPGSKGLSDPGDNMKSGKKDAKEADIVMYFVEYVKGYSIPEWLAVVIVLVAFVAAVILVIFAAEFAVLALTGASIRARLLQFMLVWGPRVRAAFLSYFAAKFGYLLYVIARAYFDGDEKKFWLAISRVIFLGIEVLIFEATTIVSWLRSAAGAKQLAEARNFVQAIDEGADALATIPQIGSEASSIAGSITSGALYTALMQNEEYIAERILRYVAPVFGKNPDKILEDDLAVMIQKELDAQDEAIRFQKTFEKVLREDAELVDVAREQIKKDELENKYLEKSYDETR
jgi:hypothetical protein